MNEHSRQSDPTATRASPSDTAREEPLDDPNATQDTAREGNTRFRPERHDGSAADSWATAGPDATTDGDSLAGDVATLWGNVSDDTSPDATLKAPSDEKVNTRTGRRAAGPPCTRLDVDGFELLKVLGEGGVGVVYEAVQESIERQIALKTIKPGFEEDEQEQQKFLSEALITGQLDHPNIVPIYDLGRTRDGLPFYAMKMVRGKPWRRVMETFSLDENLRVLLDVCDAIGFAHAKHVIHRDLKPDNVMLGEFGEVQVMDWGLGALVERDEASNLTRMAAGNPAGGTPSYMAPEMVTGRDMPVGIHSDVYLLGGLLFRIVTGKAPHPGNVTLVCLNNARENVIEQTDAAGVLLDIARKAMAADPHARYPSAGDFKAALLEYQAHAQSIRLCERSQEDLERAAAAGDYDGFSQALFGFREALKQWPENRQARDGLLAAQERYARCALGKGDLDLAASLVNSGHSGHAPLVEQIRRARQRRDQSRRRMRALRNVALGLTAAVIVILTVASIWIAAAKKQAVVAKEAAVRAKEAAVLSEQQAVEAKERAVAARRAEAKQRTLAETARADAERALAELEQAYEDLVRAQEEERRARERAVKADRIATETRDELAKSGMLLDNSWWVFDADEARARQEAAAAELDMPVDLSIPVSGTDPLELALIPAGEFVMGSPPKEANRAADEHLHRVRHTSPFYVARYELTQAQWQAITGHTPPGDDKDGDPARLPVTEISYDQVARRLLPALQKHAPEGFVFALPTEAQWEYACRAGAGSAYSSGDDEDALSRVGWFEFNSGSKVQPVGEKPANAFGLHDMHGNVAELCRDCYDVAFYLDAPVDDPVGPLGKDFPVLRGGSVLNTAEHCRAAYRSYVFRENRYGFVGVRLALMPERSLRTRGTDDAATASQPAPPGDRTGDAP